MGVDFEDNYYFQSFYKFSSDNHKKTQYYFIMFD